MIRLALALVGIAFALAACSSLPAPRPHRLTATPAGCVRSTGSLIASKSRCKSVGRSYSQRQIRRTGYTDLAQALQALDPAITAVGNP